MRHLSVKKPFVRTPIAAFGHGRSILNFGWPMQSKHMMGVRNPPQSKGAIFWPSKVFSMNWRNSRREPPASTCVLSKCFPDISIREKSTSSLPASSLFVFSIQYSRSVPSTFVFNGWKTCHRRYTATWIHRQGTTALLRGFSG